MTKTLIRCTQSLFFPGMRSKAPKKWREKVAEWGTLESFEVPRISGNGHLSALHIRSPVALSKESSSKPIPQAVLAHPISRKAKYFFSEGSRIRYYLNSGIDVWIFDFNGFGESQSIDLFYWKDVESIIEFVKQMYGAHPMVLHGLSFGSFHCVRAIASLPENSRVVLENMSRSLYDYWKKWTHTRLAVRLLQRLPLESIRQMDVLDVFRSWQRPDIHVLGLACEKDIYTPADEMESAFGEFKGKMSLVHFEGSHHLKAPEDHKDFYEKVLGNHIEGVWGQHRDLQH